MTTTANTCKYQATEEVIPMSISDENYSLPTSHHRAKLQVRA